MEAVEARRPRPTAWRRAQTFALAIYAVVAGVLGENLTIAPAAATRGPAGYIVINAGMTLLCLTVFASIMLYARRRGLV